jgi:hypothetical protein
MFEKVSEYMMKTGFDPWSRLRFKELKPVRYISTVGPAQPIELMGRANRVPLQAMHIPVR